MGWTREDIHRWVSPPAPLVIFYRHPSLSSFLDIHIFCTPVIVQVEGGLDEGRYSSLDATGFALGAAGHLPDDGDGLLLPHPFPVIRPHHPYLTLALSHQSVFTQIVHRHRPLSSLLPIHISAPLHSSALSSDQTIHILHSHSTIFLATLVALHFTPVSK